jgi:V/A-type H+-transporting ATPase subunit I
MAIQKMISLKIVGSVEDMHEVLQQAVLSEKLHFDFEHAEIYDNSYIIHEFESVMAGPPEYIPEDIDEIEGLCSGMQ